MHDLRKDFPQINDKWIYFDNAATSLKPQCVIDALTNFYAHDNANPRRGVYDTSVRATQMLEEARKTIADFIGAEPNEIIFTNGTTDGINMLAGMVANTLNSDNSEIAICLTEHHSNMLPWCKKTDQKNIKYINCDKTGFFSREEIEKIDKNTTIVAVSAYSNVLGKNLQLGEIIERAHQMGAWVVVDAAQAIAHEQIDVKKLDADFLVFSGHKVYGPMGIGVLYGKIELLEKLNPGKYGGEMVDEVIMQNQIAMKFAEIPARFEAGTLNVAGAIGLTRAIQYLNEHDFAKLVKFEQKLCTYAFNKMQDIPYLETASARSLTSYLSSIVCFSIDDVHSHDIASILNSNYIAIRAGYMCAQPLVENIGKGPLCRVSFSFYNTYEEVNRLIEVLKTVRRQMGLND